MEWYFFLKIVLVMNFFLAFVCIYRHIGKQGQLVIIQKAGHAVNLEKPKEFAKHLKSFLCDSLWSPPSSPTWKDHINFHIKNKEY